MKKLLGILVMLLWYNVGLGESKTKIWADLKNLNTFRLVLNVNMDENASNVCGFNKYEVKSAINQAPRNQRRDT